MHSKQDDASLQPQQVRLRQAAAAFLRAARATQDEAEREALRRKAAELLSPRPRLEPKATSGVTRRVRLHDDAMK